LKSTTAFSLVEVLCAVAILGIAIVGLTRGLATGLTASKEAERQTAAAFVAASRIELLRADGYLEEGTDDGELTGDLANYRWKQSITATKVRGLFEVSVQVESARTEQLIYELKTLLFDPPSDLLPDTERDKQTEDNRRRERKRS